MSNILILDGYNLFYRARYSGMNRGEYSTIFNFFRGLRPLVEKFSPDKTYCVLEGMPKKRIELLKEYKAQREYHNKDNFSEQRKEIIRILKENFPIQLVKHDDFECDDIAAHIACNHESKGDKVTIISSDTDFIQSITDNISVYNPVKKDYMEKPSYNYIAWKALRGDPSDNIEGFKGIGDKRAKSLIENNEKLKKFLNTSEEFLDKFRLNVNLISFHTLTTEEINTIKWFDLNNLNEDNIKNEFTKMDFNSIIGKEKTWNNYINTFKLGA